METIPLGTSSLHGSRLAYGCWRIAGTWTPSEVTPDSKAAGRRAVIAAFEAGYTLFDIYRTKGPPMQTMITPTRSFVALLATAIGITAAFRVLDDIRKSSPDVRNIAVIILAATDTNRLFAFQSGVDGYVVRPVHADELLDVVRLVLTRTSDERVEFRRAQLMGGATTA